LLKVCNPGDWLLLVVFFAPIVLTAVYGQHNAR
jgi:hypothetical protein